MTASLLDRLGQAHADACAGIVDADRWDALMAEVQALQSAAPASPTMPGLLVGNADLTSEHAYLRPLTKDEEAQEANLRG